ncbi:Smr/MutS family protein [Antarcticimicrobium sediminis]|uniref:DNA mismatch repair protein MutS n=1 Tax=Antarcticimicrobium sediminis TaxID=2546227 RepID=A0A4R5ER06_9RHOB|nr:Smr/MutS family protein [Antarcticimicrobium sediminis]TDE36990.1 DNA mismatch repair protein MutS [Antarcticimicrobium sediminis]
MARRKLRKDELDLWRKVTDQAERLHPTRPQPPLPAPKPRTKAVIPREPMTIEQFDLGQAAKPAPARHNLKPSMAEQLRTSSVQMDRKAFTRMKRGKLKPEARLDLHGMRQDRAHPALVQFILSSQAGGRRLVLVITGKGKRSADHGPIPTPRGVLKHQVPQWLSMSPLSQAVLQISAAHVSHGGEGAYYVYLRRTR